MSCNYLYILFLEHHVTFAYNIYQLPANTLIKNYDIYIVIQYSHILFVFVVVYFNTKKTLLPALKTLSIHNSCNNASNYIK